MLKEMTEGAGNRPGASVREITGHVSHRERDDNYRGLIAQLGTDWRVIVCREGIQWIMQRRDGARAGRARWRGVGYFTTQEALLRVSRASCAHADPAALATLAMLPDHFEGGR